MHDKLRMSSLTATDVESTSSTSMIAIQSVHEYKIVEVLRVCMLQLLLPAVELEGLLEGTYVFEHSQFVFGVDEE